MKSEKKRLTDTQILKNLTEIQMNQALANYMNVREIKGLSVTRKHFKDNTAETELQESMVEQKKKKEKK